MRTIISRVRRLERSMSLVRESVLEQIPKEAVRALSDEDLAALTGLLQRDVTSLSELTPEEKAAAEHFDAAAEAAARRIAGQQII